VANWFGPAELGQSVECQKNAVKGVGRCGDQNPNFFEGPSAGREEFLRNGVLGSPPISERSHVMGEIEQACQIQTTMEPSLKTRNGEKTATLVKSHRDAAERKRATLCASFLSEQRVGISNSLSTSPKEVEAAGKHEPRISISRVEDSLLQTSEREANQLPRQQVDNADEVRMESFSLNKCCQLWGENDIDYLYSEPSNGAEGILTIWHKKFLQCTKHILDRWFIVFIGLAKEKNIPVIIVNVYSSCIMQVKRQMWADLLEIRQREQCNSWCVLGDFNFVRNERERRGINRLSGINRETQGFNNFIDSM